MRMMGMVAAALLSAGSSASLAASLHPEGGATHVNFGSGFRAVDSPTVLLPGSKILVAAEGTAMLVYSPTCRVKLGSGVWNVLADQPCKGGNETLDFSARMNQAGPPSENVEGIPSDGAPPVEESGGINTTTLVIGGLVVGGAAAAAIALSQGGSDKPASP